MKLIRITMLMIAALTLLTPLSVDAKRAKKIKHYKTKSAVKRKLLRSKLHQVNSKIHHVKAVLHKTRVEEQQVSDKLDEIEGRLNQAQEGLAVTRTKLEHSEKRQKILAVRLQAAEIKMNIRKKKLGKRLRAGFIQGPPKKISVLLGSRSMHELLSRGDVLKRISKEDSDLYAEFKQLHHQIAADKHEQDVVVGQIASLRDAQKQEADTLLIATKEKAQLLKKIQGDEQLLSAQLDELEAESGQIEGRLQVYYTSPAYRARAAVAFHGRLRYPSAPLTSRFGMRRHPIAHKRKMHTGCDYGLAYGAPIHCAGDGVVIMAGHMRGYGNVVIVDHGGGISTLYGHCSSLNVGNGQSVHSGQVIAHVGSTGYSTGPHLHFEVRRNGHPVDPLSFR